MNSYRYELLIGHTADVATFQEVRVRLIKDGKRLKRHRQIYELCGIADEHELESLKRTWLVRGRLHRDTGPAMTMPACVCWYNAGCLHRDDGPARTGFYGSEEEYWRNGRPIRAIAHGRMYAISKRHSWWSPKTCTCESCYNAWCGPFVRRRWMFPFFRARNAHSNEYKIERAALIGLLICIGLLIVKLAWLLFVPIELRDPRDR